MELHGERTIAAPLDAVWAALNDPVALQACIAGCESLERSGDDAYVAVVAMKIGPVSARFKGNLRLANVTPPSGYTIQFDGQGGVAGFGKGSADVALTAVAEATTRLEYTARATVGGKMAQIGSRLIDATAIKITEDFFKAFEARLQGDKTPVPAEVVTTDEADEADAGDVARALGGVPATPAARMREPVGALGWALAAVLLLATAYFVFLRTA